MGETEARQPGQVVPPAPNLGKAMTSGGAVTGSFSCLCDDEGRAIDGDFVFKGRITIRSGVAHYIFNMRNGYINKLRRKTHANVTASGRTSYEYSLPSLSLFKWIVTNSTTEAFNVETLWGKVFCRFLRNGHKFTTRTTFK